MITTIARWGNSLAVRIPKSIAEAAAVEQDTSVEISLDDDRIMIRPVSAEWKLSALVARITPANMHAENDWGVAVGKEPW